MPVRLCFWQLNHNYGHFGDQTGWVSEPSGASKGVSSSTCSFSHRTVPWCCDGIVHCPTAATGVLQQGLFRWTGPLKATLLVRNQRDHKITCILSSYLDCHFSWQSSWMEFIIPSQSPCPTAVSRSTRPSDFLFSRSSMRLMFYFGKEMALVTLVVTRSFH